ncbi:MAG: sensor histidine kinase [Pseudomonadota bacterium]
MTLALFPLGIIAIYQTAQVIGETEQLRRAALFFETTAAARDERELIQKALGAAQGLSTLVAVQDIDQCRKTMEEYVKSDAYTVFAGYVQVSGVMECGSSGDPIDFSGTESLKNAIAADGPSVEINLAGVISGKAVLLVNHPVYDDGELVGFVSMSVPLRIANILAQTTGPDDDLKIVTTTHSGEVITATGGRMMAEDILPRDISLENMLIRTGQTFEAVSGSGARKIYAVAEIVERQVSVIGSLPLEKRFIGGFASQQAAALLFPFLIWACGLAVAYFGLQRMVLRHLRDLRSAMRKFALGEREGFPLHLTAPPEEFAEAERAFNRMAVIIADSEARQTEDLKDKEVLLKEVHHRVKNNLQLIASIMNMQLRIAQTDEAKSVLASLQRRVNGLAMLHRTLYSTPDLTTISSADLLEAVVKDISSIIPVDDLTIERDLDEIALYPDQAVPLSMILSEALTNALKYVSANAGERPWIRVSLKHEHDAHFTLSVENSKGPRAITPLPDDTSGGLGTKLMTAFVSQLNADQNVSETDDRYGLYVAFEQRDFQPENTANVANG